MLGSLSRSDTAKLVMTALVPVTVRAEIDCAVESTARLKGFFGVVSPLSFSFMFKPRPLVIFDLHHEPILKKQLLRIS